MVQYCFIYFPERLLATGFCLVGTKARRVLPLLLVHSLEETTLRQQEYSPSLSNFSALKHLSFRKGMRTRLSSRFHIKL